MLMNIYLDIDGVLFDKNGKPANHLDEFLNYIVNNHDAYWLTAHCKGGANRSVAHIAKKHNLSSETVGLLNKVHATDWQTSKTEAIDFSKDFIWLDDYIMESEENILNQHDSAQNTIVVNLKENPNELKDMIEWLKEKAEK